MGAMRRGVRICGWLTLVALVILMLRQGQGLMVLQAGGWAVSLLALVLVAGLVAPRALARAVPAAAIAVLLGGVYFSQLPEQTGLDPVAALLQGTAGAAALAVVVSFAGRRDALALGDAILAGALHAGLLQVLTVAPMMSPFAIWPWLAPVLMVVWPGAALVVVGLGALINRRTDPAKSRIAT